MYGHIKGLEKASAKAETVEYAIQNNLEIDYHWYYEHFMKNNFEKFLKLVGVDPSEVVQPVLDEFQKQRLRAKREDKEVKSFEWFFSELYLKRGLYKQARKMGIPDISIFFQKKSKNSQ